MKITDLQLDTIVSKLALSSPLTSVTATAVAVFLLTNCPNNALPLTKQYGTFIDLHRVGSQITNSIGSTSWAMTTSLAFFSSTNLVMWLSPYLRTTGLLVFFSSAKGLLITQVVLLPSALSLAASLNLVYFYFLSSGLYFFRMLKSVDCWFLSKVWVNWLITGGTFILLSKILFYL